MNWRRLVGVGMAAVGLALVLALAGCGPKTESAAPGPGAGPAEQVTYTVLASELENPDNKPVYVCPMEEHREQVSLDPEARCKLCNMRLMPMEDAKEAWGEGGE
jgi:hypothetical protein